MRAFAGLLVLVALLSACGAPFGDGAPPPTPLSVAGAASTVDPNRTATRSATSATRASGTTVSTRTVTASIVATRGTSTPVPALPTNTPVPARPGPPTTPSANATPGTPNAATPGIAIPGISGTPGTPRAATPGGNATPGTTILAGSPVAPTPGARLTSGTAIQIFAPYRPDGLVASLRASGTVNGYCIAGSESLPGRPDAWRCATGGRILDPCFVSATPDTAPLACAISPWSAEVTLLALTASLPRDRANAKFDVAHAPWAFQLASGVRCQAISGSTGMIVGMQVHATCSDGSQIVGMPDRSGGSSWRFYVMHDNNPSLDEQEIVVAWY
ncbi:MAG TPA: hypothetical protein VIL85_07190 [Thermomicrobiales bacterium]|jgi:hypothetical protein